MDEQHVTIATQCQIRLDLSNIIQISISCNTILKNCGPQHPQTPKLIRPTCFSFGKEYGNINY